MQRGDVFSRIRAVVIIVTGSGERRLADLPGASLQNSPANRSALVGKGDDLGRGRSPPQAPSRFAVREARLSVPHALLFCGVDILSNACPGVEFDHAVIEIIGNASFCEERLRRSRVPDDFEMPECIANPIDRGAVLQKQLDPVRRREDRHGIKENRGRTRQRHVGS